jgi:hypothetical protein
MVSKANVSKHVTIEHENGPRRSLRGPFPLAPAQVQLAAAAAAPGRLGLADGSDTSPPHRRQT